MARRNYVLFNNYEGYDFDEYKMEGIREDISDELIWFEIDDAQGEDWDNMKRQLEDDFDDSQVLVVGTTGLWNGNFSAGKLCKSIEDALDKAFVDCEYKKVWYEKGHLYLEGTHHDGTNTYEVKKVTDKGLDYYDNWNYSQDSRTKGYSEQEIHEKMWKSSKYTHLA